MKTAQELRAGNVFMVGNDPMVVQKTEYIKGGRSSAKVSMKLTRCTSSWTKNSTNMTSKPTTSATR